MPKTQPTKPDQPLHIAEGRYFTKAQVARRYGVIHQTVQQWLDKGWLPSLLIPGLGHVINAQDLEGFAPPARGRRRAIAPVVTKGKMSEMPRSDRAYWLTRPPAERILALEEIRQEFYGQAYTSKSRLARVLTIAKRKAR